MSLLATQSNSSVPNLHQLLAYVADLELEVDRLRKQGQFVQHEVRGTLMRIHQLSTKATPVGNELAETDQEARRMAEVLRDLYDPPGYHPAHDQVIAIAVRPLIEQIFRWQQRLEAAPQAVLRLELESEHVEWFPARLRHILDNLISNSLKYRDASKTAAWVHVGLRTSPAEYEFRVSDNGVGVPIRESAQVFEWYSRAAPDRAVGLGVGLAVVKLLVEQSGGALTMDSAIGQGTSLVVVLPRYDLTDFLT
jgi:signal transduction histidine kinase